MELTIEQRRAIRKPHLGTRVHRGRGRTDRGASVTVSTPVVVVPGAAKPEVKGLGYWKTTFSNGRGFTKTLYTPSTLRIEVGEAYVRNLKP